MSKTIEEQVDWVERVIKKLWLVDDEQIEPTLVVVKKALQERDRIAREEAIKECEGCVPEEKDHMLVEIDADYFRVEGHNSCREQTLQAIRQIYE